VREKSVKKVKESKSIDVKISLPITKVSFMSLVLVGLLTLVGYAGYLGVNSVWKFTHPQFNVSLDSFKSLGYIARGVGVPPIPGPNFINNVAPQDSDKANYLKAMSDFKVDFRTQFPQSRLLGISDNELLNIGWAFCTAKADSIAQSGDYSREDILETFESRFVLRYPGIEGLGIFLSAVAQNSFDQLCRGN
jgi:hypothetical protein